METRTITVEENVRHGDWQARCACGWRGDWWVTKGLAEREAAKHKCLTLFEPDDN